jgi:hypothetical protein
MKPMTLDEYAERASRAHNGKYFYLRYTIMRERILAICFEHGEFEVFANVHLYQGRGCPKCGYEAATILCRLTRDVNAYEEKRNNGPAQQWLRRGDVEVDA